MATLTEVHVPDIGDFSDVPVIEILVSPGDRVSAEDALVTLESDKATMDVPAPADGVVKEVSVSVGDDVSEGTLLLTLETDGGAEAPAGDAGDGDAGDGADDEPRAEPESTPAKAEQAPGDDAPPEQPSSGGDTVEVKVPDIGDFNDIPVIEVLVSAGDEVAKEDALVTLESDKATMDVPSPAAGTVDTVHVSVGDTVSEGALILTLKTGGGDAKPAPEKSAASKPAADEQRDPTETVAETSGEDGTPRGASATPDPRAPTGRPSPTAAIVPERVAPGSRSHATPSVRRFARGLGVDLANVTGTGRKGRIVQADVQAFVKAAMSKPGEAAPTGTGIPPIPAVDFSKFGEVESRPLSRIQRISGAHLTRAWLNIPHVTHHDEADITELESFRQSLKSEAEKAGTRVTALVFILKALAAAMKAFPTFNASLSADGQELVLKHYCNLGVAVDTPNGLVVPVVRDVNAKTILDLSRELGDISARARDGKLKADEMQGGCMSVSSLGGIGGIGFTPIVNAPEVAILGVSRARMSPVWDGEAFRPRLMLPLDLSYDHRVIDGAEAARFTAHLARLLGDIRRLLV